MAARFPSSISTPRPWATRPSRKKCRLRPMAAAAERRRLQRRWLLGLAAAVHRRGRPARWASFVAICPGRTNAEFHRRPAICRSERFEGPGVFQRRPHRADHRVARQGARPFRGRAHLRLRAKEQRPGPGRGAPATAGELCPRRQRDPGERQSARRRAADQRGKRLSALVGELRFQHAGCSFVTNRGGAEGRPRVAHRAAAAGDPGNGENADRGPPKRTTFICAGAIC